MNILKFNNKITWFFVPAILFGIIYFFILNQLAFVSMKGILLFLLIIHFFTLVPGMALLSLFRVSFTREEYLTISMGLGISINILEYFIIYMFHVDNLILYIFIVISLISRGPLVLKKKELLNMPKDHGIAYINITVSFIVLCILFFTFTIAYITPDKANNTKYYTDVLWNIGNITSISNFFPIQDIRIAGLPFRYHYFSHIFMAVIKSIGKFDSFTLYTKYMPLVIIPLLISSITLVSKRIIHSYVLNIIILIVTVFSTWFSLHLFMGIWGMPFGMIFALLTVFFFIRCLSEEKRVSLNLLMAVLFLSLTVGIKGPVAVTLLAGIVLTYGYLMIKEKKIMPSIIHGSFFTAGFMISYLALFFCLVSYSNININPFALIESTNLYESLKNFFQGLFINQPMVKSISLLIYYIVQIPTVIFSIIIILCIDAKKGKFSIFSLLTCVSGLLFCSFFAQSGKSQIFFIFPLIPIALIGAFSVIETILKTRRKHKSITIILLTVFILFATNYSIIDNYTKAKSNIKKYVNTKYNIGTYTTSMPHNNGISLNEYNAMIWIRDHTNKDDIFLTDRQYITPDYSLNHARYFYYSTFSERRMFLEGYGYIYTTDNEFHDLIETRKNLAKQVYENNTFSIQKIKKNGVNYIIQSNFISPRFQLDDELGVAVYHNEDITIYKLF